MRSFLSSLFSVKRPRPMQSLIAVVGATGTGKSKLAVDLASRFNGEIINGDAMQMYRGLPIITNQIPLEERNGIPHHLISCVELDEESWRVGMFRRECLRLIDDIRARGKLPILVGGTHYYTQSVLFKDNLVGKESTQDQELESIPAEDLDSSIKWPILDADPEVVMQKLREVDPVMADRWHPKARARSVYAEQKQLKQAVAAKDESALGVGQLRFETMIFWVHSEKATLNDRLNKRVDDMIDQGLMSEANRMSDYLQEKESQGVTVDSTRGVWVSIGFKELAPYFEAVRDGSKTDKELETLKQTCIESVKTATRQYSGSQIKWIRNKLWNALAEAGLTGRLFVLDSSNVEDWAKNITDPSERLVQSLLKGEPLPDPKSLSDLARTTLGAKEAQPQILDANPITKCMTCEVCQKTMTNEDQWNVHINGHAHKRVVKALARRAQRDEYLRKQQESLDNDQVKVNSGASEQDSKTPPP
ncbi:hypothetical protein AOCH_001957 [Aspergillus ochraceoroseus]|uniref:tRNA dimethylallyltransferase n=1 Tax=Aspergillus ochraceoroseus TaxID=138278 RepID=A0A0F8WY49_9EURO|nr:hypothetical protein AOCH_001957 [Aspergillus ochraceoroseus]